MRSRAAAASSKAGGSVDLEALVAERRRELLERGPRVSGRPPPSRAAGRRRGPAAAAAGRARSRAAAAPAPARSRGRAGRGRTAPRRAAPRPAPMRAKTPTVSRLGLWARMPLRGIAPKLGLKPTTPQKAAGRITEPAGLGADRERRLPGRHRRRRAGRGAAGRAPGRRRVAGRRRVHEGELGRHGLAEDQRARRLQPRHDEGVLARHPAGVERRAVLGRDAARCR